MEKEYKIIIILAIVAFISIAASFILISKNRNRLIEVYVGNLDNISHSIHIKIFNENGIFLNKNVEIMPNKYIKFSFVSNGKEFMVIATADGVSRQKKVKGWMINISVLNIRNETSIEIEGMGYML